jgi:hypothetical protein
MIRTSRFKVILAAALATSGALLVAVPATSAGAAPPPGGGTEVSCPQPRPGEETCFVQLRTDGTAHLGVQLDGPRGYGPADLQDAYNLPVTAGAGRTVAVIAVGDDAFLESDLATYRTQFGLPECSSVNGCFSKLNQTGAGGPLVPVPDPIFAAETALDVEMVSAACPLCHILVVEANTASSPDLGTAVDIAAARAKYIGYSFGRSEFSGETTLDAHFNHPGVAIAVSSGDGGAGTNWPAASRFVTAVGGTTLLRTGTGRGWDETAWSGAGSGCSAFEARPTWETPNVSACGLRRVVDVAAVADVLNSPVAVYDTSRSGGWTLAGGTSAGAPLIAAIYALAGVPGSTEYPAAYSQSTRALYDILQGSNGNCGAPLCSAAFGWDGPTGNGTPNGVGSFSNFQLQTPGSPTIFLGQSISIQLTASGGTGPYAFLTSALPAGLSFNATTHVISGTPTFTGTTVIGLRATDSLGVASQTEFSVTVNDQVAVPEVEGLSLATATSRLHDVGLFQVHGSVASCDGPPGTVIAQTPDEGTVVLVGSTVTLTLAKAPTNGCR